MFGWLKRLLGGAESAAPAVPAAAAERPRREVMDVVDAFLDPESAAHAVRRALR